MKVLQICAAYKPAYIYGGPTMSVSMLSEQLSKSAIATEAYATTANGQKELPVQPGEPVVIDGVTVTYFKRITKDHSHFSPALLKKLWRSSRNFDLIHIHAWWNLVSVFSCFIALLRNVPILVSPRGTLSPYSFENKNKGIKWVIHQLFTRPMLKKCHIHVTSHHEELAVMALIRSKSITRIPNFVKLPWHPLPAMHPPSAVFRLIFLSRIEEKKGLDILLDALPLLTFPYILTVAGDGDLNYINTLKALSKKNGVDKNVTWAGFKSDDKFELLFNHDLLVLPSHDENFGNVVVESLSQGTAVLISPFVGLSGYVTENNLGWKCPLTAAAIGDMLNQIYKKQDELQLIRAKAPGIIRADFNEDVLVQQYIDLYSKIIYG